MSGVGLGFLFRWWGFGVIEGWSEPSWIVNGVRRIAVGRVHLRKLLKFVTFDYTGIECWSSLYYSVWGCVWESIKKKWKVSCEFVCGVTNCSIGWKSPKKAKWSFWRSYKNRSRGKLSLLEIVVRGGETRCSFIDRTEAPSCRIGWRSKNVNLAVEQ